ncbi:efflux RND transporter periplasmic adaptor subunit [Schlesneria sp. T3-172]|uniref:efflux RND transporter periplasmic adaptor subunit n=1 Tax=Schlesneria sphaerica TaxID=3373610 RepID=UPI0037C61021
MKRFAAITVGLALLITACAVGISFWAKRAPQEVHASSEPAPQQDVVVLPQEKFSAAQIEVEKPSFRELQPIRTVPGRIDYDATRHVEVKSPFDGLIQQINVKVGDRVSEQQVIAIVDSPQLGEGRADVLLRESDLGQAVSEHDWWHSIQGNLEELVERLKTPQDIQDLEKDFANKQLGQARQQILTAYSRMRLAEKLSSNLKPASEIGAVSIRMALETGSARDTTTAEFFAACEQAIFDVKQRHLKAESVMNDAQRRLVIARQRLSVIVSQPYETLEDFDREETLSTWPVKAPFKGTVEEILLAPKERVQTSQGLFQIADTSRLWVQADIREKDWKSLAVTRGQSISVQTPALPGETLPATVAFIGRKVAIDTRAVPLTAEIDNSQGKLRPGMFVRVLIPDGPKRNCLTLPQSAIASNDGRTFVFVETGPQQYQVKDVTIGLSVDNWSEVLQGISPDDRVVSSGTNILKAEFLLEPED